MTSVCAIANTRLIRPTSAGACSTAAVALTAGRIGRAFGIANASTDHTSLSSRAIRFAVAGVDAFAVDADLGSRAFHTVASVFDAATA